MLPVPCRACADKRQETGRHLDPRARAGRWRTPSALRARPVHHALRLRRRRGPDLGQRRPGRPAAARAHRPRGRRGDQRALRGGPGDAARRPRAVRQHLAAGRGRGRRRGVVAGGIGLAPLRPRSTSLLAKRERYRRGLAALRRPRARPAALPERARALARGAGRRRSTSPWTARRADWEGRVGRGDDADRRRRVRPGARPPRWSAGPR